MGWKRGVSTWMAVVLTAVVGSTGAAQERPTLGPDDYGRFENLGAFSLDPTGTWLVASVRRVNEDTELRLLRADGSGEPIVLEHGTAPVFSPDGRWLAYRKGVSAAAREAADSPPRDRLGLVELSTGIDSVLVEASRFAFRADGGRIAVRGYPVADSVGADLLVFEPGGGAPTLIGNVDAFAWHDDGPFMAVTLRTAWGSADGVVLFDSEAGTLRTLDSRDARYRSLTWHDESGRLGVLRSVERDDREGESHDVLVWDDPSTRAAPSVLAVESHPDVPDTLRVTDYVGLSFSDDGRVVFVGVRDWEGKEGTDAAGDDEGGREDREAADEQGAETSEAAGDDIEPADVQVWHWDDDQIVRAQEYAAARLSRRTHLAAWHRDSDRFVVLGEDLDEPVRAIEGGRWGLVPDYSPYLFQRRFGDGAADWYRVDLATGARTQIAREVRWGVQEGPNDGAVQLFGANGWSSVDLESLETTALGAGAGTDFQRSLFHYDYPGPRPSWGIGGWLDEGRRVLLYDEFDVWSADVRTGDAVRLTDGAGQGLQYRVARIDPELSFSDPNVLDSDEPIWLTVRSPTTKASGYALMEDGRVSTAVFEEASVGSLRRAEDAERYAYRTERWDDSPNVVTAGPSLESPRAVLDLNPFQDDFAWGRSELVSYTTDAGHDLQGLLIYPADFEAGRTYPLILYQYERLSDGLHRYRTPSQRDYYNPQVWSQEGYFVLMPDIVYEPGRPGPSALDAVEHALDAAVATGHVDPGAMGLIGHSWGGYQASYLPTRTDRFAASVAGAAITNFLSFMGAVHWNGGLPETGHWETGQARMAAPFWNDLEGHLESSPANFVHELETPMLLMHGDADGVVDFRQGLEFYNYARRAGKEVVLLVYPGADHGLREESQQVDYHRRILEWFGHYLKGEPAPSWISEGESWVEREKRIGN